MTRIPLVLAVLASLVAPAAAEEYSGKVRVYMTPPSAAEQAETARVRAQSDRLAGLSASFVSVDGIPLEATNLCIRTDDKDNFSVVVDAEGVALKGALDYVRCSGLDSPGVLPAASIDARLSVADLRGAGFAIVADQAGAFVVLDGRLIGGETDPEERLKTARVPATTLRNGVNWALQRKIESRRKAAAEEVLRRASEALGR